MFNTEICFSVKKHSLKMWQVTLNQCYNNTFCKKKLYRNKLSGIFEVETDIPFGPIVKRDVSTTTTISTTPMVPDVWEIKVKKVNITRITKLIALDQRCPTHSPLATCCELSFTCGEWPYFQTSQNKAILDKAIQNWWYFYLICTLNMKKCENGWARM